MPRIIKLRVHVVEQNVRCQDELVWTQQAPLSDACALWVAGLVLDEYLEFWIFDVS